jgi:ATP-dependent Clp protease adaptor protein ClpS
MLPPKFESEETALADPATKLEKPKLFKVLLHNDDYTTMEFVVYVLESIFHLKESEAIRIMLSVHTRGVGVAGIYTFEVAETRAEQVTALARANEFPLLATVEQE